MVHPISFTYYYHGDYSFDNPEDHDIDLTVDKEIFER